MIDENGYVTDLELAKSILIEFFSTGKYELDSFKEEYQEFYSKIQNKLIDNGWYFTFKDSNSTFFGGPDGDCGLVIQELSKWIEDNSDITYLNNQRKVFYKVNNELKCFIITEGD